MLNDDQFFDRKMKDMDDLQPRMVDNQLEDAYRALSKRFGKEKVKRSKKDVTVASESPSSTTDVIDLKKAFRKSKHAKRKSDGGWYMIVPIRRYAGRQKKDQARGMSKKLYEELRQAPNGNVVSDYLYGNRTVKSQVPELNYTPKSNNISKIKNTAGRGNIYVSFRVVSDKSPANSWLLNRDKADPEDLSEEAKRIVNQVRGFKTR